MLELLLRRDDRFTHAGSFETAEDALAAVRAACPDVVLCDLGLPGMSGLTAMPLFREACPDACIVMYTANPEGSLQALGLGADAVIGKDTDPMELFGRVTELLEHRAYS